jgi:hypothetical protein
MQSVDYLHRGAVSGGRRQNRRVEFIASGGAIDSPVNATNGSLN